MFGSWLNCWMATPLTSTRTLFPTSHHLDGEKPVHSSRNNREGEIRLLAWESVDTRGEGIAGNSLASPVVRLLRVRASIALQALRVRSQPLFFLSTGGKGEDIVIRSRITCSLNDLT